MQTSELEALFAQTLTGGPDSDPVRSALAALHADGSRTVFDRASTWCLSQNPVQRARAANILGQLRGPALSEFRDECYTLLTGMLQCEQDATVLDAPLFALGHLGDERAIPLILEYQDHPRQEVRFAAAFALGCFPNHPQSIGGLLKLAADRDPEVRAWAVFGFGVEGDADSPEIREALLRCLEDQSEEVREEAAVGLGKRRDQRVLPKLRLMLEAPEISERLAEAAAALLGMEEDTPEWTAGDYRAALEFAFP